MYWNPHFLGYHLTLWRNTGLQNLQYSTDSLACQHQETVYYTYKILWSQAFWQASISLHFALQFCIPTWTTPLLYFKPFLEYFTRMPLCKAGTRKWNGRGRQYSLLFRKSAVLVIVIKMLRVYQIGMYFTFKTLGFFFSSFLNYFKKGQLQ